MFKENRFLTIVTLLFSILISNSPIVGQKLGEGPKKFATPTVIANSFRLPLDYWSVSQDFGVWNSTRGGYHLAQDVAASIGTPVYASDNGIVSYADHAGGYSGVVIIEHTLSDQSKVCTLYGHLTTTTIQVSVGKEVGKGEVVGYVANPSDYGYSGSPHLHFGIRRNGYNSQNYNYNLPDGTWKWTWAFVGYTRNANLTHTQKLNYDVNHAEMRGMWYHPYYFINRPSEKNPVYVTDSSPYFTKYCRQGSWHSYTYAGHTYFWTYVGGMVSNPWDPDCRAEFVPYLSQTGTYDVYAYFYADPQNSTQVPFTVYYNGGDTKVPVNQYAPNYFTWKEVKLGTWDFTKGEDARVVVTDATGETYDGSKTLNIDTIRWVLVQVTPALTIASVEPSALQTRDWGESVTYTITVKDGNGSPVSGAIVGGSDNLQQMSYQTSPTNSSGQTSYTTTVPNGKANGTYDITFIASKSGYTNSAMETRQVKVEHVTYTISGYVLTSGGSGISSVTMSGLPGSPTTNSGGYYSATVNYGWSGTVVPTKSGYTFSPASRSYVNVTSNQSDQNYTGQVETVSTPNTPSGPSTGKKEQSLSFSTGGASSNRGHSVEYQFDWGDGTLSSWGSSSQTHTYHSTGTFCVKARARCQTHPDKVSSWSGTNCLSISLYTLSITVSGSGSVSKSPDKAGYDYNESVQLMANPASGWQFDHWEGNLTGNQNPQNINMNGDKSVTAYFTQIETVSTPNTPTGPSSGKKEQNLSFGTSGASSNLGHSVEYQFDWGDGTQSSWGSSSQSHTYHSTGTFYVKARARCQTHTDKLSSWSGTKSVSISLCTLSITVSGSGTVSKSPDKAGYDYNESVELRANPASTEWQFDHWEGDLTGNQNPQNITMNEDKSVRAVFEQVEIVSTPNTPSGPSEGKKEQLLSFSTGGASSNLGHSVEYQFDWGDGTQSSWGSFSQSHIYHSTGTFQVKARARCQTHTDKVSGWSGTKSVSISLCTLSITVSGSGTVSKTPDKAGYDYNESVQLMANPSSGWQFVRWEGDLTGSQNPKTINMNGDKSVTAYFTQIETVSTPNTPAGPSSGKKEQLLSFSTGGASSNLGHSVEYQFDWGDGNQSSWGSSSQSHTYHSTSTFQVKAQAPAASPTPISFQAGQGLNQWKFLCAI